MNAQVEVTANPAAPAAYAFGELSICGAWRMGHAGTTLTYHE
jgi:hypothetical protein